MQTFSETLGEIVNASFLKPEQIYEYACDDALGTWHLGLATLRFFKESKFAGQCLQKVIYPLMKFEDKPVRMDPEHFKRLEEETLCSVQERSQNVYRKLGVVFELNSGKQLANALQSKGYINDTLVASGYLKTDIANMERLYKEFNDDVFEDIIAYKVLFKSYNSYLKSYADQLVGKTGLRFAYFNCTVPTTRLASGSDKKNDYFASINIQCVTGDTVLYTDKGLSTMRDIEKGNLVWDGQSFVKVLGKFDNGVQPVYKVKLSNGEVLRCTKEHQLYSATDKVEFKKLSDLCVGDKVAINSKSLDLEGRDSEVIRENFKRAPGDPRFWLSIESIEPCGEEEVFDIHTESGCYIANTMLVHNSTPQAKRIKWFVHKLKDITPLEEDIVIDQWVFSTKQHSEWTIEGQSPQINVRRGFLPEEDSYWVTVDFSAQEIRIPAVLSGEPTWLDAFIHNKDIHKNVALKIWGPEKYNKDKRRLAKVCNFGLLYGGSWRTLLDKLKLDSVEEAQKLEKDYRSALNVLFSWVDRHCRKARRVGTVYTYFGTPRRVRFYFQHAEPGVRAFGYRTAINSTVQGSGG